MQEKKRRSLLAVLLSLIFIGALSAEPLASWAMQPYLVFLPIVMKESNAGTIPPVPTLTPTASPTLEPAPTATATPTETPTETPDPASSTTVIVSNNFFNGENITITVGDTVIWERESGFHNVVADDESFRLGEPPDGDPGAGWESVSFTFTEIGVVPYYCEAHGDAGGQGMSGTINVQAGR